VVSTDAIDLVTMGLAVPARYECRHVAIADRYKKTFYVMTGQKRSRAASPMSPQTVLPQ
jgi:hypothetical protein